jgi:hypothetical protein
MKPAGVDAVPPWGVNREDAMDLSFPGVSAANEAIRLKFPTTETFLLLGKPLLVISGG